MIAARRNLIKDIPDPLWLIGLALVMRLIGLNEVALRYDETFTAWMARLPTLERVLVAARSDVHPPLWYVIEWVTVKLLGSSAGALRLPSAIFGVLAIWLVYHLALTLSWERQIARWAAFFAAIIPGALFYSQEARVYTFMTCCVLLALLCLIERRWGLFTIACIGLVYSHNLGVFYVFVMGGYALVRVLFQRLWGVFARLSVLLGIVVIAWLPWLANVVQQANVIGGGYWLPPLTPGTPFLPLVQLTMGTQADPLSSILLYAATTTVTVIALAASLRWVRSQPENGWLLLAVIIGAPILVLLVSALWRPVYVARGFLGSIHCLMLLWAYALSTLSRTNRTAFLAALLPMLGVGIYAHYVSPIDSDPRSGLASIYQEFQPGDVLYYSPLAPAIANTYVLPDKPFQVRPDSDDLILTLSAESKAAMGIPFASLGSGDYRRAWLIFTRGNGTSQDEINFLDQVTRYGVPKMIAANSYGLSSEVWLIDLDAYRAKPNGSATF